MGLFRREVCGLIRELAAALEDDDAAHLAARDARRERAGEPAQAEAPRTAGQARRRAIDDLAVRPKGAAPAGFVRAMGGGK